MESKLIFEDKEIIIPGAKNSILPIIAASLLIRGKTEIKNVSKLEDIQNMLKIIIKLGVKVEFSNGNLLINASKINNLNPDSKLVKKLRASFLIFGPLLFRNKQVKIAKPGGCSIGSRKIDLHLKGLKSFSCSIEENDFIKGNLLNPVPVNLELDYPSVGATEHLISLATVVPGISKLSNAAIEPEVLDLVEFLKSAGANIKQKGTTFVIKGADLHSTSFTPIPDRIFTATWIVTALLKRKNIQLINFNYDLLGSFFETLKELGVLIEVNNGIINIICPKELKPFYIKTGSFPAFPTDIQPFMAVLACTIKGKSIIEETIFENRFAYVNELNKIGANIKIEGNRLIINYSK